eukprot:103653-Alexandrium_andersonii.AAC.1
MARSRRCTSGPVWSAGPGLGQKHNTARTHTGTGTGTDTRTPHSHTQPHTDTHAPQRHAIAVVFD